MFIKYDSINKFSDIVKTINHQVRFLGLDEENNPIYKEVYDLPIVSASVTEKIHGTNAGVRVYIENNEYKVEYQSRNNTITPTNDNAGCAFFCESRKENFISFAKELSDYYNIDLNKFIITLFGEFCGGNIQKNSAVSGLDKMFILFEHFKVSLKEDKEVNYWLETKTNNIIQDNSVNIYNILSFPSYNIVIDFNKTNDTINYLEALVNKNEHSSPVGKTFGIEDNILEGYVVTFYYKEELYKFKVKGEKHSNTKVNKLNPVDSELENIKIEFANSVTPSWRLEQGWQEIFGINNEKIEPNIKYIGDFLKWVLNDVIKEESDLLNSKKLEPKQVNGLISNIAKKWFIKRLEEFN